MYIIIIGLGGIGRSLAKIAVAEKHNVMVIDRNAERTENMALKYDLVGITGDASMLSTLEEANISEADAVICTTGDDNVNLMVVLKALELGIKTVTTVVNEQENIEIFKKTGAIIHKDPDAIVAENIFNSIWRPGINAFTSMAGGKAEIIEVIIHEGSHAAGKAIRELGLPSNTLIIAIERGDEVIIPEGSTLILPNDSLYVFARSDVVDKVSSIFQ
ncbi:potassium channel family protein [Methanocella arvoryzae]|uniref:K(+) uptake system, NAD-binding component n=1 Tax=Methanocella arvoryzae (strain DSM 22066 / NBRC 105507 / MRE50) TaxID=351160 RepID=Q0W7J2_METAR|nr:NAD-binding protein [Methanocella arvoryzae]CAJ35651.1 putative K(+) uptake system, NAD-binding component [Methanocella arvoryzae MRE50]